MRLNLCAAERRTLLLLWEYTGGQTLPQGGLPNHADSFVRDFSRPPHARLAARILTLYVPCRLLYLLSLRGLLNCCPRFGLLTSLCCHHSLSFMDRYAAAPYSECSLPHPDTRLLQRKHRKRSH